MVMPSKKKPPIINCHTHVFTSDYVPPFLAKTYLPEPLYRLLSLRFIIRILCWYYNKIKPIFFKNGYKKLKRFWYNIEMFFKRNYILGPLKIVIEIYIIICIAFYLGVFFFDITKTNHGFFKSLISKILLYLKESGFIVVVPSLFFKIFFFILVLFFFKSVRNIFITALKLFKVLPGENFIKLFERYVQIGLFSKYKSQKGIYDKLKKQYPLGTQFISLPMDMEYMKAGSLKKNFTLKSQMAGLLKIKKREQDKNHFHPFVFAHPERIKDKTYFDYSVNKKTGEVKLKEGCLLQIYLEKHKFSGVKIYPALGYYPFDIKLLPLWKYCVQNDIPIMTHCIKGTIFYRGIKKTAWDSHPVFTEGKINKELITNDIENNHVALNIDADYIDIEKKPLHLNEVKNIDFSNNFTNPLNYLCLLDEKLLTKVILSFIEELKIEKSKNNDVNLIDVENIQHIFGYKNGIIERGLKDLKICFAHFGGDDQWKRFLESDRDNYTSQLILKPEKGIDFFKNIKGEESPGKLAYIWKYVDWYTIVCSIMLQYDNVYADISYILHDEIILPLLKQTLSNEKLANKVLYGSDFYVVRNHKSDKAILADMRAGLNDEEFDKIARYNPRAYLNLEEFK